MDKPVDVFDREDEWVRLDRHVTDGAARLGVVTGRRRAGKTYLLRRLAEAHGGLYVPAVLEERTPAIRRFARAVGAHHGTSVGEPGDWDAALRMATMGPLAVPLLVIDEYPYLLEHSPELESVLQHVVDDARDRSGTRIVLCGSSLSIMGGLLAGARPLRGRADLQLHIDPFDHVTARAYWNVDDLALAFQLDAVVGGLPGYRPLVRSVPSSVDDLAGWLADNVLSPSAALYREADYVLGEDRSVGDRAIYRSLIATIAAGEHRPSRIAGRVGRAQTSLSTAFRVLIDAGFVHNDAGLLSGRDPLYRITDPIVRFLAACVDPWRPMIEDGRIAAAWQAAQPAWHAQVLGPHLERIARTWAARHAPTETLGAEAGIVGRAELPDAAARVRRELDLVVLHPGERPGPRAQVLAIGECKLHATLDAVAQLDRAAALVEARGHGRPTRKLLIAATASDDLRAHLQARTDTHLVDLDQLYT